MSLYKWRESPGCCASLLAQHPSVFCHFYKVISWKSKGKNLNRAHAYLDVSVMESIYVITCIFYREVLLGRQNKIFEKVAKLS